ncbi:S-adenosylmethionine:diacylglycerol 3-amino-3-carboxypropyl transferase [Candidatus Rhodobacter oscarellae]|uniref:S-adenosylmethionine:diacylglycerol 3-amino-3-carboxypropyl transferase n=1 Tax=Candidatus Rhodobacter oscarellae TaxID=1675527 RepID=A0A0J9E4F5_9RHOB|nr:DUF3419 family protein [Candidatus Rhodobacter lobularis]KMW57646.1 S-adenosylmethionine:diacylglycerol 3-amino-3-carboxypropyl transferase [Candidatus Rhodobacter lobularis]
MASVTEQLSAAVNQNAGMSREGMLERAFARLFHGLVYAQIWEDPVVDMEALQIQPEDNIVCIASGGCNVLSYLTANPASITAVDLSPAHVMLNKLKLATVQNVPDHATLFAMLGRGDQPSNVAHFDTYVAPHLDDQARTYWNARNLTGRRKRILARGLYRHGLLGRFIGIIHLVAKLARVDFAPLLASRSLAEQTAFFENQIVPLYQSRLVRFLARRRASLFGLGIPPAQYDKLAADAGGDIVAVLQERTRKLFCDFPIADNYFAWQAAYRGYQPVKTPSAPPYLAPENFAAVRANAARVTVLNRSLTDLLAQHPTRSKQCYVLLDAQDWMNDDQLNALWDEITRTAAPGARVIFRTGGKDDILPGRVDQRTLSRWVYQADASAKGLREDRSAIYGGFHLYHFKG